jgi:hypothetical protein
MTAVTRLAMADAPVTPEPAGDPADAGALAELAARLGVPVPPRVVLQGVVDDD